MFTLAFLRNDKDARQEDCLEVSGVVVKWRKGDSDKQQKTSPGGCIGSLPLTLMLPD